MLKTHISLFLQAFQVSLILPKISDPQPQMEIKEQMVYSGFLYNGGVVITWHNLLRRRK